MSRIKTRMHQCRNGRTPAGLEVAYATDSVPQLELNGVGSAATVVAGGKLCAWAAPPRPEGADWERLPCLLDLGAGACTARTVLHQSKSLQITY